MFKKVIINYYFPLNEWTNEWIKLIRLKNKVKFLTQPTKTQKQYKTRSYLITFASYIWPVYSYSYYCNCSIVKPDKKRNIEKKKTHFKWFLIRKKLTNVIQFLLLVHVKLVFYIYLECCWNFNLEIFSFLFLVSQNSN